MAKRSLLSEQSSYLLSYTECYIFTVMYSVLYLGSLHSLSLIIRVVCIETTDGRVVHFHMSLSFCSTIHIK